ncbi:MAG: hypothetical protein K2R98_19395 [Gemmataceae bacterium]|nr:hypothetical protein [Gemmataceae bacterium]
MVKAIAVKMEDGSVVNVSRLLGQGDNPKLVKSDKSESGYLTYGLSLAPALTSGFQTCPFASDGCKQACIFTSGFGGLFPSIPAARIAKTRAWFLNRDEFKSMLRRELANAVKAAAKVGKLVALRLNVFSDIPWEKTFPELFTEFPTVQFYDYTKNGHRAIAHAKGTMPANYHLTFSRSETNDKEVTQVLKSGNSVTVVFDNKKIPATWNGYEVINGDQTDLRFLDKRGVIVGLYAKGKGRKDTSGFVVSTKRVPLAMA